MVLTRYYARIIFDNFEMELSRARNARFISITLHATEATGLVAQVRMRCVLAMGWFNPMLVQLTRCCHQLIATRFRCLRSIMLVNITKDELVPVSLNHMHAPGFDLTASCS